tara:strand:+ start:211 stop:447 length:237 start_codon:yes stop_codon:yes gene_type:complete
MNKIASSTNQAESHKKIKHFLEKLDDDLMMEAMDDCHPEQQRLSSVIPTMKPSSKNVLLTYGETKFEIPIIEGTNGDE